MRLLDLQKEPTMIEHTHESLYRSYHILLTVEELLRRNVPNDVILDLLDEIRKLPPRKVKGVQLENGNFEWQDLPS